MLFLVVVWCPVLWSVGLSLLRFALAVAYGVVGLLAVYHVNRDVLRGVVIPYLVHAYDVFMPVMSACYPVLLMCICCCLILYVAKRRSATSVVDDLGTASPNGRQALYHLSVNMSQVLTQLSNTVSKLSANHDSTANVNVKELADVLSTLLKSFDMLTAEVTT